MYYLIYSVFAKQTNALWQEFLNWGNLEFIIIAINDLKKIIKIIISKNYQIKIAQLYNLQ